MVKLLIYEKYTLFGLNYLFLDIFKWGSIYIYLVYEYCQLC